MAFLGHFITVGLFPGHSLPVTPHRQPQAAPQHLPANATSTKSPLRPASPLSPHKCIIVLVSLFPLCSIGHKTGVARNKQGPTHSAVCFFLFFSVNKSSGISHCCGCGKKIMTEFIKKIKSRKFKEAKSLRVARVLIKGMVLGALGKCILLIKNN